MRNVLLAITAAALCGCSTLEAFDNRISCSMDGKHAYLNSMYGPLGVASRVTPADAKAICSKVKEE